MNQATKKVINELIIQIKAKGEESVEKLHDMIAPTLRFIAFKYLQNIHDADDLVQDFWVDIYKIADKFNYHKNGFSYLCKIMERKAMNRYKQLYRVRVHTVEFVEYEKEFDYANDDYLRAAELRSIIEEAMRVLSGNEKIVIQLTFFECKTVREIARDLNVSKTHISRIKITAIEKLKKEFEKTGDKFDF